MTDIILGLYPWFLFTLFLEKRKYNAERRYLNMADIQGAYLPNAESLIN